MNLWLWAILLCIIALLALVEFAVIARKPRIPAPGEALAGTGLWVVAAALFARVVYVVYQNNWLGIQTVLCPPLDNVNVSGGQALVQFFTVYVAEMALSLDNIAVLALLLAFYKVPAELIGRVLYWAITLALLLRLLLIFAVGPLSVSIDWFHYVFAALMLFAAVRTFLIPDAATDISKGWIPRFIKAFVHVSDHPDGARLTTRIIDERTGKRRFALTPLTAVVLVVAIADSTYAADFLPAAYSITKDPFLAAAGNAFALLTLRSLYFTIAPFMGRFRFLKLSLVVIMLYIAISTFIYREGPSLRPAEVTLVVICGVLFVGVIASVLVNKRKGLPVLPIAAVLDPTLVGTAAPPTDLPQDYRPAPIDDVRELRRHLRKVMILIAGTSIIVLGIIIAPLPGPGFVILAPIGVAVLATEFVWAKSLMDRLKSEGDKLAARSDAFSRRIPKWVGWLVIPVWPAAWFGLWWLFRDQVILSKLILATAFGLTFPIGAWVFRLVRRK